MKKTFYLIIFFLIFIAGCHNHTYEIDWSYDEINHYHKALCCEEEISDLENHQFIEEIISQPTHSKKGEVIYICSVCDYMIEKELEMIEHTFSSEYYYNRTKHYYLCDCGEKQDIEEHDYSKEEIIIEATQFSDGLKKYICKCGSEKEEVIKANDYKIDSKKEEIYLITTSAGHDISKSVGISWHCNNSGSYLIYQKEGTTETKEVVPNEEYWSIEQSYITDPYQNKRYVCTVDLNDLEPNSKYLYKIISGDISSNVLSFKTADTSSSNYSFLSFVDFQYSKNATTLNLVKKFTQENPESNLITCSGDITDEGYSEESHRYLFDSTVFSNSILAFGVGDHEYWGTDKSPIKMLERPYSYNKLFNNPNNGCEGYLNSSYYFKYNTTLFVFLDCGDSNVSSSNEIFSKQAKWLNNVLSSETYDFVIVCMHKSLYGDPKQDSTVRKFAPTFTNIFDKYKVDLVISGHDHEYSRTKALTNGNITLSGTIYLDLGNSGSKTRATGEDIKSSSLYDKYIDMKTNNYSFGIVGKIINDKLIIEVRDINYKLMDIVEIDKKFR